MKYNVSITVTLRKGILDVQGKTVEHALHGIGYPSITNVRIGRFVELVIEAPNEDDARCIADEAGRKLIANPIMEDFHVELGHGQQMTTEVSA